ncbi:response regulator [Actinoplanes utahensis]|uniref:Response regulatory domain-containing protein n=1 Tax=Actinoplanes utahensis TaxID=1869 RepID=A0A0A6UKM7_ACTUT|nr:response regulator [Actinoplanes utahensis]KHD74849.1 hypothetical protein MB27_26305 [Actinoplanes utahensis]GIF30779.1 hypothetical protein Aut01nite_37650 [Actinoplanes utahensis]
MARVLVVEDEPDVRDLVVRYLRRDGHDVLAVDSGLTALAAVEQHGMPELAVLDVAMPGMDGLELLRELRLLGPRIDVLFLTALWLPTDLNRIRDAGAAHLAKPFTVAGLGQAMRLLESGARS